MKDQVNAVKNLLARVPHAPGEVLPTGATDDAIEAFQHEVGYPVPSDLRCWLKMSNGPGVGPGGLFGVGAIPKHLSIRHHLLLYPEWKNKKWLPIAGDGCGNYYLLVASHDFGGGFPIVFAEPGVDASSPAYVVASDLWNFLGFLLRKELGESSWPFKKSEVIAQDPAILHVSGVPMPWD